MSILVSGFSYEQICSLIIFQIRLLLSKNASVTIMNKEGFTPLDLALGKNGSKRNQDVVDLYNAYCGEDKVKAMDAISS